MINSNYPISPIRSSNAVLLTVRHVSGSVDGVTFIVDKVFVNAIINNNNFTPPYMSNISMATIISSLQADAKGSTPTTTGFIVSSSPFCVVVLSPILGYLVLSLFLNIILFVYIRLVVILPFFCSASSTGTQVHSCGWFISRWRSIYTLGVRLTSIVH